MELFDLAEDAMVRNADGEKLGEIEQFVVDPSTRQVTHVVVKQGLIFKEHRVVPIDQIDRVDDQGPVLSSDVEADDLTPYETEHYVPVDDGTVNRYGNRGWSASFWRYPVLMPTAYYPAYPGSYAPYAGPRQRAVTDINVPDNSDLIGGDTAVESANGESIGTVAEVTIDEEGRLSHVTVDLDTLGEKVVPAHWIESIGQDKLVLAVGDESLEWLDRPPSSETRT